MKKVIIFAGLLAAVSAYAGSYSNDFNSASAGSTNLGDGTTITSVTGHAQVYDTGSWKALRLTQDQVTGQTGNFALYDLDPGSAITSFSVTFDALVKSDGGSTVAADGFSFNFGQLPTLPNGGEAGMSSSSMLSVAWDTYEADNGHAMSVFVNGALVTRRTDYFAPVQTDLNGPFTGATIVWDENGLDVLYNGVQCWTDLDVSGFTPSVGDRFAFAARTGDAYEDVFIDNLNVQTVPEPASATLIAAIVAAAYFIRRRCIE